MCRALILAMAFALVSVAATAQTAEEYKRLLSQPVQGGGLTRSLRTSAPSPRPLSRSIIVEGAVEQAITEKKELPKVDVRVPFEYNSTALTPEGRALLVPVAEALKDASFRAAEFLVAGHTDARGSDAYNMALSEGRATTVRDHLIREHGIVAEKLVSRGFGKRELADPKNPEGAANRRVEFVRLPPKQ